MEAGWCHPSLLLPGKIVTHSTFNDTFPLAMRRWPSRPIVLQMLQITAVAVALSPILRLTAVPASAGQSAIHQKRCKTLHFDQTQFAH